MRREDENRFLLLTCIFSCLTYGEEVTHQYVLINGCKACKLNDSAEDVCVGVRPMDFMLIPNV